MRYSFSENPAISVRLFDLLDTVFPGVREVAENARRIGAAWESVSTPFIHFLDERAVSHVGIIELSLVLAGQPVTVGSIHGVATHPEYRRHGHYRRVMEEALQYGDERYETLILTTEHPEYFTPFGFRVIQEHVFTVSCAAPGNRTLLRLLDLQQKADAELLLRLLKSRAPISTVVGVSNETAVFCFNEGWRPLHYAADLDVIICLEMEGTRLKLFDVVGTAVPPLADLLEQIPQRITEVEICFAPDRLAPEARATPYLLDHDGPSYLMARGPFAAEAHAFTLPRSART